ncbi:hypothetical protein ACFGVR_19505 [Mucilaginibacter sp. AW1-3]
MSQILNFSVKTILCLAVLSLCGDCFAQYTVKRSLQDGIQVAETSEYYTYKRSDDSYNGISFKTSLSGKQANNSGLFKINLIYTTTSTGIAQTIKFRSATDSSLYITATLTPAGTQPTDNKKFTSTAYAIDVADSLKIFLTHQSLKQVLIFDAAHKQISGLDITSPSFFIQQFTALQAPQIRRKPPVKKSQKHSS